MGQPDFPTAAGTTRQATAIDCDADFATLLATSDRLAVLPVNATTVSSGAISLTGTDPGVDVFAISSADLGGATALTICIPAGATAIVNIAGDVVSAPGLQTTLNGPYAQHVLYNLAHATNLATDGVVLQGTLLAPRAAVAVSNGQISGGLIGASLTETGVAFRDLPFAECLPNAEVGAVSATPTVVAPATGSPTATAPSVPPAVALSTIIVRDYRADCTNQLSVVTITCIGV